jgi:hypothetical protein
LKDRGVAGKKKEGKKIKTGQRAPSPRQWCVRSQLNLNSCARFRILSNSGIDLTCLPVPPFEFPSRLRTHLHEARRATIPKTHLPRPHKDAMTDTPTMAMTAPALPPMTLCALGTLCRPEAVNGTDNTRLSGGRGSRVNGPNGSLSTNVSLCHWLCRIYSCTYLSSNKSAPQRPGLSRAARVSWFPAEVIMQGRVSLTTAQAADISGR